MPILCFLVCIVSDEKFVVILICVPLFSVAALKIFLCIIGFDNLIMRYHGELFRSVGQIWNIFSHFFFNFFFLSSCFFWKDVCLTTLYYTTGHWCSVNFSNLLFLCFILNTLLLLIFSPAVSNLLLIWSSGFFITDNVFFIIRNSFFFLILYLPFFSLCSFF